MEENSDVNVNNIPEEYKPISAWGYVGYNILFAIPIIGLILTLVFSFGGTQNKNLKNYARSFLIVMVITAIVLVTLSLTVGYSLQDILSYYQSNL